MQIFFKQKYIAKLLLVFVFFNFLFFSVPQANAWDLTPITIPMGVMMTEMLRVTNGVILGAAKKAALTALEQEISYAITGSSANGVKFIADWRAYMVDEPQKKSNIYINDYISQALVGRGSRSGYEGVGDGPVFTVNYHGQLAEGGRNAIGEHEPRVTYKGDPSRMFASGNFRNFNNYLSGINNPWAFNMHVQDKYQTNLKNEKDIAMTMAISYQGFTGTIDTSSGIITAPGILAKDLLAKVKTLPMDIMAAAQNIPEILTSIATQIITQSITQGIGSIQASVHSEISNVRSKMGSNTREAIKIIGPEVLYKKR